VSIHNGLLNLLHLILTMLFTVLYNSNFLFLSKSSCPKFNILGFLFLLFLGMFSFFSKQILIELENLIVINFISLLNILYFLLANLFNSSDNEFSKNLAGTHLSLLLQIIKQFVSLSLLSILDLLSFEFFLLLECFFFSLLSS